MKKLLLFLCSLLIAHCSLLFASGNKDDDDKPSQNNEWVLCVTAFENNLSSARRITGDVITRDLVNKLQSVSYRLRISPEYAYYEGYAWQQSVSAAAKALSNKQNERSQLLFRGEADWRYRRNLKRIDTDLEKLEEDFLLKEAQKPLINTIPSFALTQSNLNGTYPTAPQPGGERRFCQNQKADAFLSGEIREFHGRYFIGLRLFTLFTNTYIYEDEIIFSLEDTDGAVEEIAARLTAVLAGNKPASIAITADPPESQILINHNYAGRGTVEAREHPPGKIIIAVGAEGFSPVAVETELMAGELTNVAVTLSPLYYADVNINVPQGLGAAVYHGALYVGEAPYVLSLPIEQLNYVFVETSGGEAGKAVFTAPDMPGETLDLSLKTKMPYPAGERRVNKARNRFYWAWGGTWLAGMAAWASYGIYSSQNNALYRSTEAAFYDSTALMMYVSTGAIVLVGVAVAHQIFQLTRYIYISTENVTPIVKQEKSKK